MSKKVKVREIDGSDYIGTLIQFSDYVVGDELPRAIIEDENGYVDSVPIDRIKILSNESEDK